MNTCARRLCGALLTLALLVLPAAAAQAEPPAGAFERWTTSLTTLLGDLLDGLLTVDAASESGGEDVDGLHDDGTVGTTIRSTEEGNELKTTTQLAPGWDPAGMA